MIGSQSSSSAHVLSLLRFASALVLISTALPETSSAGRLSSPQADVDFGDAPDPDYPTLLASTGASHVLGTSVYLGSCVDAEPDGQPTAAADGDDTNISSPVYGSCTRVTDEDGVGFVTQPYVGGTADIVVNANAACTLSAWIDFNGDGDWADTGESLFPGGQPLIAGANALSFAVPASAVAGDTYARFRCTTDGAVSYSGAASDGEVEDYDITIDPPPDFGDAPDPGYPTLAASAGASHILGSDVYLGSCVDAEADGQPLASAAGDDTSATMPVFGTCSNDDDEDGVTFASSLLADQTAEIEVVANAACTLSAWIDFSADGDWNDGGENLFPGGQALVAGSNALTFTIPASAVEGDTYARFRCTTDGAMGYTGQASDGEVEDYSIRIGPLTDYGDAPYSYPTTTENSGANHILGSSVYLGSCVDAETDGQASAGADGDDTTAALTTFGTCVGNDDEDGVTLADTMLAGDTGNVEVVANAACALSAWIDFNGDADWDDPGENLFPGGQPLAGGINVLTFTIPADAGWGKTYARFRCTTDGAVGPTGAASDGEVEDYLVDIVAPISRLPLIVRD